MLLQMPGNIFLRLNIWSDTEFCLWPIQDLGYWLPLLFLTGPSLNNEEILQLGFKRKKGGEKRNASHKTQRPESCLT